MKNDRTRLTTPFSRFSFVLCFLFCWSVYSLNAQTSYPGGSWEPGPPRYGISAPDSLTITLADGVKLRAQVYAPTGLNDERRADGSFPVIVEMTPYPRLRAPISPVDYLVSHGYIYAVVRPRGSGGSTGELQQFSSIDGMDGTAVVDWASQLEGSDGTVGLYGCSYPGRTALATAAHVGPDSPVKAALCALSAWICSTVRYGRPTACSTPLFSPTFPAPK